jgi:hypothetical protein
LLTRAYGLLPARRPPDSLEHQQVDPPDPFLSPTTTRLSPPPPNSLHGSSNTQLYYIPAGDARGLGIITETSESSASLAALSPRQAIIKPPPSVNTQTQTLSKTHSAQDNATAPLSLLYIPIAEAAKKRAVDGLVLKEEEPEAPDPVGRVASFAIASSSVASSAETAVS